MELFTSMVILGLLLSIGGTIGYFFTNRHSESELEIRIEKALYPDYVSKAKKWLDLAKDRIETFIMKLLEEDSGEEIKKFHPTNRWL